MHLAHWGLAVEPFRQAPGAQSHYFRGANQQEALARLGFVVDAGWRLSWVRGEAGVGKTRLLEEFAALEQDRSQALLVNLWGLAGGELVQRLALESGLWPGLTESTPCLWRRIEDHWIANRYQGRPTVVLLDDVDRVSPELAGELMRLVVLASQRALGLSLVVAAPASRQAALVSGLCQAVELVIDLVPWELDQTAAYLEQQLAAAGRRQPIFSPDAVRQLHELSGGVVRRLNHLAELALLAGAGNGMRQIDAATVESVFLELGVPTAATA